MDAKVPFRYLILAWSPLLGTGLPESWFGNKSKTPVYIIIFMWFLAGSVIAHAYKSNLLANLVKVGVEPQPETIEVSTTLQNTSPFNTAQQV